MIFGGNIHFYKQSRVFGGVFHVSTQNHTSTLYHHVFRCVNLRVKKGLSLGENREFSAENFRKFPEKSGKFGKIREIREIWGFRRPQICEIFKCSGKIGICTQCARVLTVTFLAVFHRLRRLGLQTAHSVKTHS